MSSQPVAVTGLGMVTPAGMGTAATWEHLCTGAPTAMSDPELDGLAVDFSCRVRDLDGRRRLGARLAMRLDRFGQMAIIAAREAVTHAALDPEDWNAPRVGVVLGVGANSLSTYPVEFARFRDGHADKVSPFALPRSVPNMVAGAVSLDLGAQGPSFTTSSACASGTTALAVACDLLRSGACDIVISGGSESGTSAMCSVTFGQMQALSRRCHDPAGASRPFDADRDGFVLGEGAGILVLERTTHARARGAHPLAYLTGHGSSSDAHHYTSPHPEGDGLARAIRSALTDADLASYDIGHVNAHGTSTELNDKAEAQALRRVFRRPPPVTANKSVIGHSLGAAGAIEAALTVLTLQHQLIPPTANLDRMDPAIDLDVVTKIPRPARIDAALTVSSGFGGQNAALVLTRA
ncbi:beta-ketoacyl synthase [Streptomyces globisporus]|uniref:beta-ketoacyl-[acyl-carrier-protein] synthase family protein n=1 Tax=Streptomyces globisporus TaxID=1908 RepID=UPI0004CA506D|nr:beta-ketoacyl-[acyl-carrier-protein] synthase family protein [Streptomyces globisporus]